MMRRVVILSVLLPLVAAAESWIRVDSGPFQVLTNAGDRGARELLNQLEQLRWTVGTAFGNADAKTAWPVRILLLKPGKQGIQPVRLRLARDAYVGALAANTPAPREWLRDCVRLLVEANSHRLPAGIETGLETFYSTFEAAGTKITLGQPVPPADRTLDWARIHLIVVDANYYGKIRVLLYNLQQGGDPTPAFRNAFGKTPADVDKEAAEHLAAGKFATVTIGGKPLNPRTDFHPAPVEGPLVEITQADLKNTTEAYLELRNTAAVEARAGLGLLDVEQKRTERARAELTAAVEGGTTSARAWLEYARLVSDSTKARAAIQQAEKLNPDWAEPHVLLAQIDSGRKIAELEAAAKLEPRNAGYWRALAEAALAANQYPQAARAWAAAENASVDEAERERIHQTRLAIEQQRLDFEAAERKRKAEEQAAALQKVKDDAMARVRAAEEKANRGQAPPPPDRKIVPWWEGPAPSGRVSGRLVQVECVRGPSGLVVQSPDGKSTRLMIRDPAKIVVMGGSDLTLECGVLRPGRPVVVEYFPKADAKHGTAGEVATIDYSGSAAPAPPAEERKTLKKH